jgi:hypothetical protein
MWSSYLCTHAHPSFVKLVHFITCLVQAVRSLTRRRSLSPTSTHTSLSPQPSARIPSPVLPLDPVSSQAPLPQCSYSPLAPSVIPALPLSSTSLLVKSSEGSTIGEYKFETPAQAIRHQEEVGFLAAFTVFEPENTPEQQLIEGLQIQIEVNPHFWPVLEQQYGNLGEIPGTGGAIVREFYYIHYLQHKYPQVVVNYPNPVNPSLHSERDLLDVGLCQCQYLDPEATQAHLDQYSQYTYNDTESDFGAPKEQDFTIHSPHPSAGLTPVLVPETLSVRSGENTLQGATSRSATPSQERQSQS